MTARDEYRDDASGSSMPLAFETPVPIYEWPGGSSEEPFELDFLLSHDVTSLLFELEMSYHRGEFEKTCAIADTVIASSDSDTVTMSAMATRILAHVALGNADAAFSHLNEFVAICRQYLTSPSDSHNASIASLCARRVEAVLMVKLFDMPPFEAGVGRMPDGLIALLGCVVGLQEIRNGNIGRADGIVYAVRGFIGERYPISRVFLLLLRTIICIQERNPREADAAYARARKLAWEAGIVMPFIELDYLLCGMQRRSGSAKDEAMHARIDKLAWEYNRGWFGIREKLGIHDVVVSLTPYEWYVFSLAGSGWRNKEIATHLSLSENTVKHQLTSCFQKTGITKRSEIPAILKGMHDLRMIGL